MTMSNNLSLIQTYSEEILNQLTAIDPSKASGPDELSGRFLKECATVIAPSLTGLNNLSQRLGKFPTGWKCANVVPVFKKSDNENG